MDPVKKNKPKDLFWDVWNTVLKDHGMTLNLNETKIMIMNNEQEKLKAIRKKE